MVTWFKWLNEKIERLDLESESFARDFLMGLVVAFLGFIPGVILFHIYSFFNIQFPEFHPYDSFLEKYASSTINIFIIFISGVLIVAFPVVLGGISLWRWVMGKFLSQRTKILAVISILFFTIALPVSLMVVYKLEILINLVQ